MILNFGCSLYCGTCYIATIVYALILIGHFKHYKHANNYIFHKLIIEALRKLVYMCTIWYNIDKICIVYSLFKDTIY